MLQTVRHLEDEVAVVQDFVPTDVNTNAQTTKLPQHQTITMGAPWQHEWPVD
jgi:hypothetical protein